MVFPDPRNPTGSRLGLPDSQFASSEPCRQKRTLLLRWNHGDLTGLHPNIRMKQIQKQTWLLKMVICSWFTHQKWWFSIVMLVITRKKNVWKPAMKMVKPMPRVLPYLGLIDEFAHIRQDSSWQTVRRTWNQWFVSMPYYLKLHHQCMLDLVTCTSIAWETTNGRQASNRYINDIGITKTIYIYIYICITHTHTTLLKPQSCCLTALVI